MNSPRNASPMLISKYPNWIPISNGNVPFYQSPINPNTFYPRMSTNSRVSKITVNDYPPGTRMSMPGRLSSPPIQVRSYGGEARIRGNFEPPVIPYEGEQEDELPIMYDYIGPGED